MLCHDPRCPEKRYNLKFSMEAMFNAKEVIKELKENKEYNGFAKEEADLNYRASVEWYNELLADSRITGEEGKKWIADIDARYQILSSEKKQLEEQIDTMNPEHNADIFVQIQEIDERIKELREEYPEAYRAFYATFEGQKHLFKKLAQAKKKTPKSKIEIEKIYDQIFEGQNLHKQQIIAMIIVDKKNSKADLPIEIKNIIDTKILSKEELKEVQAWLKENPEFITKNFVSLKQEIHNSNKTWLLKETPESPGITIPEPLAKTLYVMPLSTYRGDFIKDSYQKALANINSELITDKKTSPTYQKYLENKYDYDMFIKFENKLKNRY